MRVCVVQSAWEPESILELDGVCELEKWMGCTQSLLNWALGRKEARTALIRKGVALRKGASTEARRAAKNDVQAVLPREAEPVQTSEGGILFAVPLDLLLLHVVPKLALPDIVAVSSTCLLLRVEVDGCARLWSELRPGCTTRAAFQEAYLSSCAKCHAPEAGEYSFEHSPGLCAHCASRMPTRALKDFCNQRRLRDWRIGAAQRSRARAVLRDVLRAAGERARRPEITALAERPLRLGFSSARDGHSLNLLLHTLNRHAPTLLVVREHVPAGSSVAARSFGVFIPVRMLRRTAPASKSDEACGAFLFSLPLPSQARSSHNCPAPAPAASVASIWPGQAPDGTSAGVPHFYATASDLLAFGGDAQAYALQLAPDLQCGVSLPCPAFRSPTLSSTPAFRIAGVEAWRIVGVEEEEHEWQSAQAQGRPVRSLDEEEEPAVDGGENAGSVLEPGSNRFMLEFVNMREDLLLARRAQ